MSETIEAEMSRLIELALTGAYTPMEFCVAARHVPGYDLLQAPQLEAQLFDCHGWPKKEENDE